MYALSNKCVKCRVTNRRTGGLTRSHLLASRFLSLNSRMDLGINFCPIYQKNFMCLYLYNSWTYIEIMQHRAEVDMFIYIDA